MRGALGGPRVLLRRLREVMAEPVSAQEKLDRIVVLIANNMVAEVCSVYVLRADGNLELYATEGLKPEAVHRTVIGSNEGLVGLIASSAEPLALSDAQSHEAFSYKPETGEEIYHSFLGVPILRAGQTLGVLVVQNRAYRVYTEEEIEALQTTTMVIAEMVASGDLQTLAPPGQDIAIRRPMAQRGVALSEGIGLGYVVLHEPRVVVQKLIADDVSVELKRIDDAIAALRARIDSLLARGDVSHSGEHRDVLETVRMFAHDQGWLRRIREAIMTGLTAEGAVERVQSDTRARILRQTDPYLRERLHDLDELANRLLHELSGAAFAAPREELPDNAILVARTMGPAALLDYDRSKLRGLVLEEGGKTSHIAIVARALGIPAVGEIEGVVSLVEPGDAIIVDGLAGEVQIRPQPDVEAAYAEKARLRARAQAKYKRLRKTPSVTKDGVEVTLNMNAGLLVDIPHLAESGASGIGLFRTELQFMVADKLPSASEQQALYEEVLRGAGGAPVTFRTLDIGGDKVLPYMEQMEEENPALGWRAIRIALDRPALLRSQVRALLKAAAGASLRMMFPMVATVDEFLRARALVERERSYLRRHGYREPEKVELGVMVEVPSLLFQLDEICAKADFISVGSNDLMQFLFAADRENRRVSGRFDTLSPGSLRALRHIVRTAGRHGCPATVCGEMSGRPLDAMALIGLGFRALSMPPAAVGPVKQMLLGLEAAPLAGALEEMLADASAATLRPKLEEWAAARSVPLE
ncbi:phosphoenolpyruvate--protein phosphotransferase [Camelimonas abortus]|uniref:phosphoenolpyruvate--protein phosphotransferase n=1 Tax=Camelimonas abortus TaxID=1017184 RepID=A0ABV7LCG1_9HYPH